MVVNTNVYEGEFWITNSASTTASTSVWDFAGTLTNITIRFETESKEFVDWAFSNIRDRIERVFDTRDRINDQRKDLFRARKLPYKFSGRKQYNFNKLLLIKRDRRGKQVR